MAGHNRNSIEVKSNLGPASRAIGNGLSNWRLQLNLLAANRPDAGKLRGYFGQPGIQQLQLFRCWIDERHAHPHAVLHVNDLALRLEDALVARNAHVQAGALRQCDQHVHVTSLAADLRNPPGDARIGMRFAQFDAGDQREARYFAVLAIGSARVNRCTGESAHELFSHRALANSRTHTHTRTKTSARVAQPRQPFHPSLSRLPPTMNPRFLFAFSNYQRAG